jgi:hypothetical protein
MTARASGPLWGCVDYNTKQLLPAVLATTPIAVAGTPCRLIPGHGKVVPVELVTAIEEKFDKMLTNMEEPGGRYDPVIVTNAIDAAIKGAI